MSDTVDQLAATIAEIFQQMGWVWGLGLAGIPEHVPDEEQIAAKIQTLIDNDQEHGSMTWLTSHGRIALATINAPPYDKDIRVFLHIGEIPART